MLVSCWWSSLVLAAPFRGTIEYTLSVSGPTAELMAVALPQRMLLEFGKHGSSVELSGGMMPQGRFVTEARSGRSAFVQDASRTVADLPMAPTPPARGIEELGDGGEIAGFPCRKFKVVSETPMGDQTAYVWAAPGLPMPDAQTLGGAQSVLVSVGSGMPLKVEVSTDVGTVQVVAVRVDRKAPPKARVLIPADYAPGSMPSLQ
jgi:hypothetical protein